MICRILLILFTLSVNGFSQNYWAKHPSPTTKFLSKCFFTSNSTGWITGDSGTIIRTTNGGNIWEFQHTPTLYNIEGIFFLNDRLGWALVYEILPDSTSYPGTRILNTTNGGDLWTSKMFPDTNIYLKAVFFIDSLKGFLGGSPGVIYSTSDGGGEWGLNVVDSTSKLILPVQEIKFLNSMTGFASGGFRDIAGSMWKTTNGGLNWKITIVGPEPLNDLIILDPSRVISVGGDFEYGSSYVVSSNAGSNWLYDTLGIFGVAKGVDFRKANEGWIAIGDKFCFTRDTGNTWTSFYTPDSLRIEDVCFPDTTYGWAVGYDGVILKYDASQSGTNNNSELSAGSFSLSQNFPNPFNPITKINYELRVTNYVFLKVYDVLGKEVATLVNEKLLPGSYEVVFNGDNFPSGVYFYELIAGSPREAGEFKEVKRMVLLK